MANLSNQSDESSENPQISLSGLQRLSTRNTSSYDRHGNRVTRSATQESVATIPGKQATRPVVKNLEVESQAAPPAKRRPRKQSFSGSTYKPLRKVPPGAETKAILLLAQDLHVFPDDARDLVSRYETVRKISPKLPAAQRRDAALRVMKLSSQHYDQFLRAWKRYVVNREIAAKPVQDDEGDRKIAKAMNVNIEKVRWWRKRVAAIIVDTRPGNDYSHFDRIAVQMGLAISDLKRLISLDPAVARAMRLVHIPKPPPRVTRIPTQTHTSLKEPKRAPGVRTAGISNLDSENQCPSCGVVPDLNGQCGCR